MKPSEKIVLALDVNSFEEAKAWVERLEPTGLVGWWKVGYQLFMQMGASGVERLRSLIQGKIFLDLKLHDIPNTVKAGVTQARSMGAQMVTVHCSGGQKMLEAAVEAMDSDGLVLGVTVLTSFDSDQLQGIGLECEIADQVLRLGQLAQRSGVTGLVCSAEELALLRRNLGPELKLVTPGIRLAGSDHGDQKRVATPGQAIGDGADFLVLGRTILGASHPETALQQAAAEVMQAAQCLNPQDL
ncbi:MAG: orotidine-5'-phosphate decarboxylase [Verrucomicrobiales bacterium]